MNINKTFSEILAECGGIEEMKKAFDKFIECETEIKVGSIVRVTNWGRNYSINREWFINNGISRDLCIRYAFDNNVFENQTYEDDVLFEVLAKCNGKALITPIVCTYTSPCFLVGVDALKIAHEYEQEKGE